MYWKQHLYKIDFSYSLTNVVITLLWLLVLLILGWRWNNKHGYRDQCTLDITLSCSLLLAICTSGKHVEVSGVISGQTSSEPSPSKLLNQLFWMLSGASPDSVIPLCVAIVNLPTEEERKKDYHLPNTCVVL